MKITIKYLLVGAVSFLSAGLVQAAEGYPREAYRQDRKTAEEVYRAAREDCNQMSGHPKDVCLVEAKAAEDKSKAYADAKYKNTARAYRNARIVTADGEFLIAKEKCNAATGDEKKQCLEEARTAHLKAVDEAKASKEMGETKKQDAGS